jgi:RNA polymerase sigma-70 factor (ECF subfamily)
VGVLQNLLQASESSIPEIGGCEAELVSRAKQGDTLAITDLYRRYLNRVYDFAALRLESQDAAEDATQTIFMRALASLPQCRDNAMFAGWLFAIARNVVNDSYRLRRYAVLSLDIALEVEDPAATPEDLAAAADWSIELADLRERCLNGQEREILDLRLQGLSDKEIAAALGRGYGAIRTAQYRMVLKLRKCMGVSVLGREMTHVDQ